MPKMMLKNKCSCKLLECFLEDNQFLTLKIVQKEKCKPPLPKEKRSHTNFMEACNGSSCVTIGPYRL
jgi:hypothetical protein